MSRSEVLEALRAEVAAGRPILGTGAGTGLSAKSAEAGGTDLIVIYNSGRFRMAGRPSPSGILPFGRANDVVWEMAPEILGVVDRTPVIAGVCGFDTYTFFPLFLRQLKEIGIQGVQNFPSVGGLDGTLRREVEETGMGFEREVELIRAAHELDLVTVPYTWDVDQAERMTAAGADIVVAHVGLSTSGAVGAVTSKSLDESVTTIQEIHDAAKAVNPDVIVLCHGGPIVTPEDAQYIFERTTGIVGYFGASSIERIPVEKAISGIAREFKSLDLR